MLMFLQQDFFFENFRIN